MWFYFANNLVNSDRIAHVQVGEEQQQDNEQSPITIYFTINIQKLDGDWISQRYFGIFERDRVFTQLATLLEAKKLDEIELEEKATPTEIQQEASYSFFRGWGR